MYFETKSKFLLSVIMIKMQFIFMKRQILHYVVAEAGKQTSSALSQYEKNDHKSLF